MVGSSLEALNTVLAEINETTAIDSFAKSDANYSIVYGKNQRGKLCWNLETKNKNKTRFFAASNKYTSNTKDLLKTVKSTYSEMPVNEELSVICYASTEPTRNYDGMTKSNWLCIEPSWPYEIDSDFRVLMPHITLNLSDADYDVMMETQMAFYNEFTGIVYPIKKSAISSIGKLLDAEVSFKMLSSPSGHGPLGQALLLAEKLGNISGVKLIWRDIKSNDIRPIIGIAGSQFYNPPQIDFFKEVFDYCGNKGDYTLVKWRVSEQCTIVDIKVNDLVKNFEPLIRVTTADVPGIAVSVTAYAKIGDGLIRLLKNKKSHTKEAFDNVASDLFVGVYSVLKQFDEALSSQTEVSIEPSALKEISRVIGVKNSLKCKEYLEVSHTGTLVDLLKDVIDNTFFNLPVKQADELADAYYALVNNIRLDSAQTQANLYMNSQVSEQMDFFTEDYGLE